MWQSFINSHSWPHLLHHEKLSKNNWRLLFLVYLLTKSLITYFAGIFCLPNTLRLRNSPAPNWCLGRFLFMKTSPYAFEDLIVALVHYIMSHCFHGSSWSFLILCTCPPFPEVCNPGFFPCWNVGRQSALFMWVTLVTVFLEKGYLITNVSSDLEKRNNYSTHCI